MDSKIENELVKACPVSCSLPGHLEGSLRKTTRIGKVFGSMVGKVVGSRVGEVLESRVGKVVESRVGSRVLPRW